MPDSQQETSGGRGIHLETWPDEGLPWEWLRRPGFPSGPEKVTGRNPSRDWTSGDPGRQLWALLPEAVSDGDTLSAGR